MNKLPLDFYRQKTAVVAKKLLGKTLVHIVNGQRISGIITETEAYLGTTDRACHTFGDRRTTRTEAMYLPGGHSYVYFIYGMYNCFNVVTRDEKSPEAVLIRALEPVDGIEHFVLAVNIPPFGEQLTAFLLRKAGSKVIEVLSVQ